MTIEEISDIISVVLLIGTGLVVTTFVILYTARSRWHTTAAGRALLTSKVSLALIVWWSVVANIVGAEWLGRNLIRPLFFLAIFIAQCMLLRALVKAQSQEPHDIHVR